MTTKNLVQFETAICCWNPDMDRWEFCFTDTDGKYFDWESLGGDVDDDMATLARRINVCCKKWVSPDGAGGDVKIQRHGIVRAVVTLRGTLSPRYELV